MTIKDDDRYLSNKNTTTSPNSSQQQQQPPNNPSSSKANFQNVTVSKPSKYSRVGISFATNKNGELVISRIAPDGLFANSGLESNMYVLGIQTDDDDDDAMMKEKDTQNKNSMTPTQAAQLVKDAESTVTVCCAAVMPTKQAPATTPTTTKCIILRPKRDFSDLRLVCLCEQPIRFNYSPNQVPPELLNVLAIDNDGTTVVNDRVDLKTWQKTHRAVRRLLQQYIRGQCCMAPLGFTGVLLPLIIWHTQVTRKTNVKRFEELAREQRAIYRGFGISNVSVYREFLEGNVESCGLEFYFHTAPENENE